MGSTGPPCPCVRRSSGRGIKSLALGGVRRAAARAASARALARACPEAQLRAGRPEAAQVQAGRRRGVHPIGDDRLRAQRCIGTLRLLAKRAAGLTISTAVGATVRSAARASSRNSQAGLPSVNAVVVRPSPVVEVTLDHGACARRLRGSEQVSGYVAGPDPVATAGSDRRVISEPREHEGRRSEWCLCLDEKLLGLTAFDVSVHDEGSHQGSGRVPLLAVNVYTLDRRQLMSAPTARRPNKALRLAHGRPQLRPAAQEPEVPEAPRGA